MANRFTQFSRDGFIRFWPGLLMLVAMAVSISLMLACSTKYSTSRNGLVVVSTQQSAVMDTFTLNLGNGKTSQINNSAGPPTNGVPTGVVLGPGGTSAYVLVTANGSLPGSMTGIETFPVQSNGKLGTGTTTTLAGGVLPVAMTIDSSGKFLFAADAASGSVAGGVSVLSIASGGALTEVSGSPFALPAQVGGTTPSAAGIAVTASIYPPAYAVCSGASAPSTEDLYVTDAANYWVVNYAVSAAGALTFVSQHSTGAVPSGVAVDPCNRFVYVSNSHDNTVSAFTACHSVTLPFCSNADFSLNPVSTNPVTSVGNTPGPLLMDPQAKFLYVLNTGASSTGQTGISAFSVGSATGVLTALSPASYNTASFPTSIAIRSDDTWMFVTNLNSNTLSEYAITPSTGQLTPQGTGVQTDNNPAGVAVR